MVRMPARRYVLKAFTMYQVGGTTLASAEFFGTPALTGDPLPPNASSVISNYAYVMEFEGDKGLKRCLHTTSRRQRYNYAAKPVKFRAPAFAMTRVGFTSALLAQTAAP